MNYEHTRMQFQPFTSEPRNASHAFLTVLSSSMTFSCEVAPAKSRTKQDVISLLGTASGVWQATNVHVNLACFEISATCCRRLGTKIAKF